MRRTVVALMGAMLIAGTASAQTSVGGYVEGFAGLVHVPEKTTGLFGGEAGFEVMDGLALFGNLGYALNLIPDSESVCTYSDCVLKMSMTFFTGGARYSFPAGTAIRPYAAAA